MYLKDGKYEFKFFRPKGNKAGRVDTVGMVRMNPTLEDEGWFEVVKVRFNPNDGKSGNPPMFNKRVGQYLALLRMMNLLNISNIRQRVFIDTFLSKAGDLPEWVEDLI